MPEQVQDFYPTPSTISTCMYYTGLDPRTMKPVYVPKSQHEKEMQRALIQYRNPENYDLVMEALHVAHRTDLIGFGEKCLIRPRKLKQEKFSSNGSKKSKPGQKRVDQPRKDGYTKNTKGRKNNGSSGNVYAEKLRKKKKTLRNVHKKK